MSLLCYTQEEKQMKRIHYLDMARGFAVLWMLFCQLLDMFSYEYDLYSMRWLKYVNWLVLFMVVAGFSLRLAYKKYSRKRFYVKVLRRLIYFGALGVALTLWCGFSLGGILGFGIEILLWIGLLSAIVSLLFLVNDWAWFATWIGLFMFLGWHLGKHDITGAFNPLWLMGFMCFGVVLAYALEKRLVGGSNPLGLNGRIFSFLGRHALFLYFFHFAIIHKLLTLTDHFKTFNLTEGILLTMLALFSLTSLSWVRGRLNV